MKHDADNGSKLPANPFMQRITVLVLISVVIGLAACITSQAQIRDTTVQYGPKLITEGRSWVRVVPGAQYDAGALHPRPGSRGKS